MSIGVEAEFRAIEAVHWSVFYKEMDLISSDMAFKHATLPENKVRNRYKGVNPFDHSRIALKSGNNDYINASFIFMEEARRGYVLTQGPLPATCGHFWQMVWEQRSSGVVMLNRLVEHGSVKCSQYWPPSEMLKLVFNTGFKVTLTSEAVRPHCTVRRLELQNIQTQETRQVLHFHYTDWPDSGVPENPDSFLSFLSTVRESGCLMEDQGPLVVHCSSGIGRSGVFCLVDTCLLLMYIRKDPLSVSVRDVLLNMREYRMGLIQTALQLRFSYLAIIEGAKAYLKDPFIQEPMDDLSDDEDFRPMFTPPNSPTSQPPSPPPSPPPRPHKFIEKASQDGGREPHTFTGTKGEVRMMPDNSCSPSRAARPMVRPSNTCLIPPMAPPVSAPHRQPDRPPKLGLGVDGDQASVPLQRDMGQTTERQTSVLASVYLCTTLVVGAYICYRANFH